MSQALLWENISLSVDLLHCTSAYREFLKRCGACAYLHDDGWLQRAVYRYEVFWMPLLSIWNNTGDLQPPLDVHWVWHAHLLRSAEYAEYCRSRFGKVLRHKVRLSSTEEEAAAARTRVVWRNEYPGEMYDMDVGAVHAPRAGTQLPALAAAAQRELLFGHQVALPHYSDAVFLRNALLRYKQLLLLRMLKPGATIGTLPCDVFLIQRVHLMHPVEYLHDVERFSLWASGQAAVDTPSRLGSPHRFAFTTPDATDAETWRRVFHEPLFVDGSSCRGPPSHRRIHPLYADFVRHELVDSCELTFDDLKVTDVWSGDKNIVVEARRVGHTSFTFHSVFRAKGKAGVLITGANNMGLGSIPFDSKHHRGIELQVYSKSGVICASGERHLVTSIFSPKQSLAPNGGSFRALTTTISVPKVSYTDPTMTFKCTVKTAAREPYVFSFDRDKFVSGRLPADARPFLAGWLPWPLSASADDIEFSLARHSLKHRGRLIAFGVQMVKLEEMDMMGVFLFQNNDRLVAVAHSVGSEHLPSPDHVSNMCSLNFDAEAGDHAMVVRNYEGDWCICVGRWEPSKSPEEGRVQIRICRLDTFALQTFTIQDSELRTIEFEGVAIDMPSGRLSVSSSCETLAEHVALAYAVGIIFVACQRMANSNDGCSWAASLANGSVRSCKSVESLESLSSKASSHGRAHTGSRFSAKRRLNEKKRSRRRKLSASFTFLLACGLRIDSALGRSASSAAGRRASNISAADLAAAMAANNNRDYVDDSHIDVQL